MLPVWLISTPIVKQCVVDITVMCLVHYLQFSDTMNGNRIF